MTKLWNHTTTSSETEAFSSAFWSDHQDAIASGQFWADRIKTLRGEPIERLRLAIENLPLPAAFREAAIAVRSLIREARKMESPIHDHLAFLYWLAAVDSFSIPYSEELKEPGYNILESIPAKELKALPFSYTQLGYKYLPLLNKTDVKWLVAQWGEPKSHNTLHQMHIDVWVKYEKKLFESRAARQNRLASELLNKLGGNSAGEAASLTVVSPKAPKPTTFLRTIARAFAAATVIGFLILAWRLSA